MLKERKTSLTVRLPADLAGQALAAWQRDEAGQPGPESDRQKSARQRAASLALIGLSVEQTGRPDGSGIVCELGASIIRAALEAVDEH